MLDTCLERDKYYVNTCSVTCLWFKSVVSLGFNSKLTTVRVTLVSFRNYLPENELILLRGENELEPRPKQDSGTF